MGLVAAKCTQCGANIEIDDTKEAGICKFCGTAFITEKAITNYNTYVTNDFAGATINVTGPDLDNLYQLARRFRHDGNSVEAAKYYDMIIEQDPSSWEAYFYVTYYKALLINKSEIQSSAMSIVTCLDTVFDLIDEGETTTEGKESAITEVADACLSLATGLHDAILDPSGVDVSLAEMSSHVKDVAIICMHIATIGYMVGDKIEQRFPDFFQNDKTVILSGWKQGVDFHVDCIGRLPNKSQGYSIINEYVEKIGKYDNGYVAPVNSNGRNTSSGVGGCYIATCVYGSYDCPQVWTLRRFRDYTLDATWYGRLFIKCYYTISPTLVKCFGETKWFRSFWKSRLDKMVSHLNNNGVHDTYYHDKY